MDDLMNKIQNVLNDEESMKQIKEFADMLTADNGGQGEQGGQSEAPQSPQNMDFSQLLQSLGGVSPPAESKPAQATQTGGLDIAKLMKIQSIMQSASKPDKNIQSSSCFATSAERRKSGENRQAHKNIQAFCGLSRTERKRASGR